MMRPIIDLRSDTVTRPDNAMRSAMAEAEVGDDVFGEDPTVNTLQEYAADLLGKEAALFVSSGVMGNQLCLKVHTVPGDEVICEKDAHIFNYESGSPAALSGISIYPVKGERGVIDPADAEDAVRPASAYYMPRSKVLAVENTHNRASGAVIPLENIQTLKALAEKHKLKYHLDGARIWNASVASGISVKEYASYFDSVSCCLSKGLGAPVGSLIAGSRDFIKEAFRLRKAWGGGMRQVGILAAAGLYALKNNRERLREDHQKAKVLADCLAGLPLSVIDPATIQTNILLFKPVNRTVEETIALAKEKGVLLSAGTKTLVRAVTHKDVSFEDITRACIVFTEIFGE